MDNTSLEVIFRSVIRQADVQRALSNYFGRHVAGQRYPESSLPLKVSPPAFAADPHRILRAFSCIANPVIDENGEQEVWYPADHPDKEYHSHGPINDMIKKWELKRRWKQQDRSLHRGDAYEGDEEFPWPSDDFRGHPVFWCEHYKVRIIHAEIVTYLAQAILSSLGRPTTPEAADELIDELYAECDPELLEQYRQLPQRYFDEMMFFRPTVSRQFLEQGGMYTNNSGMLGGYYSAWTKVRACDVLVIPVCIPWLFCVVSFTLQRNSVTHDRTGYADQVDPALMWVNPPVNDEALRQPAQRKMRMF